MAGPLSRRAHDRALKSIPGGVNSPVRSFSAVGGRPLVAASGEGAYVWDIDGARYVDHLMSWGAVILGHADPDVVAAISEAAARGSGFGLSTEPEAELAELIREALPSVELVRLVNSGTEAVMTAVRLARGFTGRDRALVFEGGYHGHSDGLLAAAGSGLATFSVPRSAGVPDAIVRDTLVAPYNDLDAVAQICARHADDLACILVEPVAANMGVIPPRPGFLEGLRALADRTGAVLIFDEVITGFRLGRGGAQGLYGVRPDLTTLGKIIGGGLPVGAFGGRRDIMEQLAPLGPVYQAGTLSGNPVVASAGVAVLRKLGGAPVYEGLAERAARLADSLRDAAADAGLPARVNQVGPLLTCFFTPEEVVDYPSAKTADTGRYAAFFGEMLRAGVLVAPSQMEACFVSVPHTDEVLRVTAEAARGAMRAAATSPV